MLGNIDGADYYKPILAKESFKGNCQYYQIRGDRDSKLSLKQYLCKITPELVELINEKKKQQQEWTKDSIEHGCKVHTHHRQRKMAYLSCKRQ